MSTATSFKPLFENFVFETVSCYSCGSASSKEFIVAQDDLTGKPGSFRFVTCQNCGLTYQNPRIRIDRIKSYYDDEYIDSDSRILVRQPAILASNEPEASRFARQIILSNDELLAGRATAGVARDGLK